MTTRTSRRATTVVAALTMAALLAAGCGDGAADGGSQEAGEPAELTVGLVPIADVAPIYLGIEQGFFADEGIDLHVQTVTGGAEVVAQVMSGSVEVGFSNTPTLLSAAAEGLPIQIVAPAGGAPQAVQGDGENIEGAAMVRDDSSIRRYADLGGRTVAVNGLGNVGDLALNAALERNGVDPTTVERLEMPFPEMLGALDAGRVDAALLATPFKTMAEQSGGYRAIGFPLYELRPELIYISYFVSGPWAEENEDVLERFLAALHDSMLYAADHEQETRETIGAFTELPPELVAALPVLNRRPDCEELETSSALLGDMMVEQGTLESAPDLVELIRPGYCDG